MLTERLNAACDVLDRFRRDDAIDVEDGFYRALDLGHAENVSRIDAGTKIRRGLNFIAGERNHFFDAIDDEAHLDVLTGGEFDLNNDDTGAFGKFGLQAKLDAQIDDGNDAATKIDHALDEFGHLRNGRYLLHANDFAHLQNGDAIGLIVEGNGQIFTGIFGVNGRGNGRGDGSAHRKIMLCARSRALADSFIYGAEARVL